MSTHSGPDISNDGLVFAYDMSNTQKSWKGAPVTNLALNTDYSNRTYNTAYDIGGFGGDDADVFYYNSGGYNNLPYKKMVKHTGGSGGSYINEHGYFTLVEGTTYIITCYMKSNIPTTVSGHTLALNRDADNAYRVPADIALTTEWVKQSWTYTCAVGEGGTTYLFRQIVYNDTSLPVEVYWSGLQISVGTISYPYVNGTRSNTQAILDFTNNNTITANSLTYASDGTFSFNGTSDYIDCGGNSLIKPTTGITVSTWIKFNGAVGNNRVLSDWHQVSGGGDRWIFYTPNSTTVIWWLTSNGQAEGGTTGYNFVLGQWVNLVGTYNQSQQILYVNGVQYSAVSRTGALYAGNDSQTVRVGRQAEAGSSHNGLISNVQIYNRALSAQEIQQNFNATRGRYGI